MNAEVLALYQMEFKVKFGFSAKEDPELFKTFCQMNLCLTEDEANFWNKLIKGGN